MVEIVGYGEESNTFYIFNYDRKSFFNFNSEVHNVDSFDTQLLDDKKCLVLKLNNSGTGFIFQYINDKLANFIDFKSDNFIGRECGKILPKLNRYITPILKEVYFNKSNKFLNCYSFNNNSIVKSFRIDIIYKKDYLIVYVKNIEDEIISDKFYNEIKSSSKSYNILSNIKLGEHLLKDGKYIWSNDTYKIIERKPENQDVYKNIILDFTNEETKNTLLEKIGDLKPNEKLENQKIKIITYDGNIKYLSLTIKNISDEGVNYQKGYYRDITTEIEREHELEILDNVLENIQISKKFAIYYKNSNGTYHWTSNIYDIIERDPLPDDKYNNILLDLANPEVKLKTLISIDNIDSNQLSDDYQFKIKTDKGNIKYLLINVRKAFDDNGNFIQGSCYVRDVTDVIKREHELERLNNTLNDAEKTNKFTIYYRNFDGSYYYWTPGMYNIIERDPLPGDKFNHILLDLTEPSVKQEILDVFDRLRPNELSEDYQIKIRTFKGNVKYLIINSKKVFDDNNDFIQGSCYVKDITEEVKREHELERLNNTLNDAEKTNKFTIYYRNFDGSYYYWTPGMYEIIERDPLPDDKFNHILFDLAKPSVKQEILDVYDRLKPNELSEDYQIKIKTVKGNVKYLIFNFKKVFDDNGDFIQGNCYVKDITEEYNKNMDLKALDSVLTDINKEIGTGSFIINRKENYWYVTEATYDIIDINKENPQEQQMKDFQSNFLDGNNLFKKLKELLNDEIHVIDGVWDYKSPKRDYVQKLDYYITRKFIGDIPVMIGGVRDITKEIKEQELLKQRNEEMNILIRESNHRTKNNLNLLLRFISLEKRFNKDNPEKIIENTIGRIDSLSVFHEKLYKSDNYEIIKLNSYFTKFMNDMYNLYSDTYPGIKLICEDFDDFEIKNNTIIPLALILNELIINSLKYAYEEYDIEDKEISLNIVKINDKLELQYNDNGKGLPKDFNPKKSTGLGWTVIRSLVGQIDGEYEVYNDKGMNFRLTFPI